MSQIRSILFKGLLASAFLIGCYPLVVTFLKFLTDKSIIPFSLETISVLLVLGAMLAIAHIVFKSINRTSTKLSSSHYMPVSSIVPVQTTAGTGFSLPRPNTRFNQLFKEISSLKNQYGVMDEGAMPTQELAYYAIQEGITTEELPRFLETKLTQKSRLNDATLFHELGHAVVAYTLGIYIQEIVIHNSEQGHTLIQDSVTNFSTLDKGNDLICVFMAGALSETKFAQTQFIAGAHDDYARIESLINILKYVHNDEREASDIYKDASTRTLQILEEKQTLIEHLHQQFRGRILISTDEFCTAIEGFKHNV